MKSITLHPEAESELRESVSFYEREGGRELALYFEERIRASLLRITEDPSRFPRATRYRAVQKCRVHQFPFSIYYLNREQDIWVVAIAHASRLPGYWTNRIGR